MSKSAGEGVSSQPPGEEPGALSRLLDELARGPHADTGSAWGKALRPGDVLDRFEILRELGRGGFGAVYEALDKELGRKVALKTVRPGRSRDELASEQIRREAQAAASLSHPGVVTLHEACTCDQGPYLVMELLRGETLEARLARGPLPQAEAVEVGLQMARALAHVHGHGLVHRDLKPGNVFLGDDSRVKLLDLGLAHLLGRKSSTGGTPAYVAPEQWRGEEVDGRADVFTLGAVLFEMVSGRRAFEVKEERSSALDPGPAPALGAKVPRGLARLVARCLAKEPAGRPTAAQAAEELLGIQRGLARPRAVRRVGLLVGAGVAVGVAAVAIRGRLVSSAPGAPGGDVGSMEQAASPASTPSIAVLPFADMSPGKDQEYLSDGIAEEILIALARVEGLRVVGRTSSWHFKGKDASLAEIGRQLRVSSVLEGSVRRDGARLRVSAKLLAVTDGRLLWSESYDRELGDVLSLEAGVARAVAEATSARLRPARTPGAEPAILPEAHLQYLLGRSSLLRGSPDDLDRAAAALQKALELEPAYSRAWAAYALVLEVRSEARTTLDDLLSDKRRALEAAERAVVTGPSLADGFEARGFLRAVARHEWVEGRADIERAIALGGNAGGALIRLAPLLAAGGRPEEAMAALQRCVEVEPLAALCWVRQGILRAAAGQFDGAREAYRRALEIAPAHYAAPGLLAQTEVLDGHASAVVSRTTDRSSPHHAAWRASSLALAYHALGRTAEARRAFEDLVARYAHSMSFQIAEVAAWRGDPDAAFWWLERAVERLDTGIYMIRISPFLRPLHSDPRWKALLRKLNLPVD